MLLPRPSWRHDQEPWCSRFRDRRCASPCVVLQQAFESLAKDGSGVFEAVGASQQDVLTKVRMMALLGLGAHASTLSFQDVQVRCRPPPDSICRHDMCFVG